MVDNFKVECTSKFIQIKEFKEPYEAFGIIFYPQYNNEGKYRYHSAVLDINLVAKINIQGKLSIENSLHKYYHGNNFTDFTLLEIQASVEKIEGILGIPSNELKFKRIEIGCNILNDERLYERFEQYKMKDYENMRTGRIIYGRKFYLTDFNIKMYNKYLETKLNPNSINIDSSGNLIPENLNRFEIEFKRMRELNKYGLIMLSDITKKEIMKVVINALLNKLNSIEMNKKYNYTDLSPRERELIYAGKNPDFWKLEKKMNENTYKKKRIKYKDCIKALDNQLLKDPKKAMIELLSTKVEYLLAN